MTDSSGTPLHGWYAQLLPLLDNSHLHSKIDFTKAWDHPDNTDFFKTHIGQIIVCGGCAEIDAAGFPVTMYSANSHVMGINSKLTLDDITDGASQTLLIGEIVEALPPWGAPGNARDPALGFYRGPKTFGGPFQRITQFARCDGAVRSLSENIDPRILQALATPAGGEDVNFSEIGW